MIHFMRFWYLPDLGTKVDEGSNQSLDKVPTGKFV